MSAFFSGSTTLTGKSHSGMFTPFLRPTKKRRPVHPLLLDRRGEKLIRIQLVRCFTYMIPIPDCREQAKLKWLRKISAIASMPLFLHMMQKTKMDLHEFSAPPSSSEEAPSRSPASAAGDQLPADPAKGRSTPASWLDDVVLLAYPEAFSKTFEAPELHRFRPHRRHPTGFNDHLPLLGHHWKARCIADGEEEARERRKARRRRWLVALEAADSGRVFEGKVPAHISSLSL
ncbi:hypothetical protein Taro_030022 [Colocasia esculenta]|uniref:Uncharacterized protein n=1 Tax=Colocasia esculenta TaxID=4460 RepID=A0A843VUX5_COLES|nr:hypothetical protein [Colocasia esculenta]